MSRNSTDVVTTIGIDIGKNNFHLIGLNDRLGSPGDSLRTGRECLVSGAYTKGPWA